MSRLARIFWLLFALSAAVYLAMVLWTLPAIRADAGGLPAFDLRPAGYSADEAQAFLSALSDRGRALYLGPQRVLDLAYPALMAATLVLALRLLLASTRLWVAGAVLALAAMGFDYLENSRVHAMLVALPDLPDPAGVARASFATVGKSLLTSLALIALLAAALHRAAVWIGRRRA